MISLTEANRLTEEDYLERFFETIRRTDWETGRTKHSQTNTCFLKAARLGIAPALAFNAIVQRIESANGVLNFQQIQRQLDRAYDYVQQHPADLSGLQLRQGFNPPVKFSPEALQRVAAKVSIADPRAFLIKRSVIPVTSLSRHDFLRHLYVPGERAIIFTDISSSGQFLWSHESMPDEIPERGSQGVWFLANPVDGERHWNPRDRKVSRRSQEAVTAFRFMVVESDQADETLWLRTLVQLPLPICAIYTSGGRSIHCLVKVDATSKGNWDGIKAEVKAPLITLGADPGALSAVRLTRLPQTWRGEKRQQLLYLNPSPTVSPIFKT